MPSAERQSDQFEFFRPKKIVVGDPSKPDGIGAVRGPAVADDDYNALLEAVKKHAKVVSLPLGTNEVSYEDDFPDRYLASVVASGADLVSEVPWLETYYRDVLLPFAEEQMNRKLIHVDDFCEAIFGNVLFDGMRLETHVDHQPVNVNWYLQVNPGVRHIPFVYTGGSLVLGQSDARSYRDVVNRPAGVLPAITNMMTIVAAQNIPHTVDVIDTYLDFPWVEHTASPEVVAHKEDDRNYRENVGPFILPELPGPYSNLWDAARISINFAYSTHEFQYQIAAGKVQSGIASRILKGIESVSR